MSGFGSTSFVRFVVGGDSCRFGSGGRPGTVCGQTWAGAMGSFFLVSFLVRVRRETGKKSVVRVHHGEGVAIHIDPESCADAREGIGEALTGERIGQAIEPQKKNIPGCRRRSNIGRQNGWVR